MVNSSFTAYRKIMQRAGNTSRERNMRIKSREFVRFFEDTLDRETCLVDGVQVEAVFQDHSQSNNKDLSDDKWFIVPNSVTADVGSYVEWRDQQWLIFTEETKTIPTHQQMKIKHVNEKIRWIADGKICNNGNGWGAYVQNQTLYTLGVNTTGHFLQVVNAKMMLYMQNNEETRKLKTNTRIFVGDSVYKIKFRDIVSRVGLINFLLEEDTINVETDDVENRLADYKDTRLGPNIEQTEETDKFIIDGSDTARCGRSYVYHVIKENDDAKTPVEIDEWIVEDMSDVPFYIQERDTTSLSVRVKDDARLIGTTTNIIAHKGEEYINFPVKIISKY